MMKFEKALTQRDQLESTMETVIEEISGHDMDSTTGEGVTAADIESILSHQAVAEESTEVSLDQEIDEGLKSIQRLLKEK